MAAGWRETSQALGRQKTLFLCLVVTASQEGDYSVLDSET